MSARKYLFVLMASLFLSGVAGTGHTAMFPNPDDTRLADDIDGNGLFYHGQPTFSVEIFDLRDASGLSSGLEFGFYFAGASADDELITIFDTTDFTAAPFDIGNDIQGARIDFTTGKVGDIDEMVNQDSFTNVAGAPIGFYIKDPNLSVTLFTQAILNPAIPILGNPAGVDYSGAYRRLGSQFTYLITFAVPGGKFVSANVVGPISPVPIPGAAGLWLLGMAGLALFRRRLGRSPV